ncbi:MAG TPA: hypothetical protein EYG68_06705 [Leucothrix mucor]|nr:hypothetical protein [Leucothrix mucor]
MSAGIIYSIFIILSLALLVGWYLLVKKIRAKTKLSSEQLFLLSMALLFVVILIIWRGSNSIEGWDNGPSLELDEKIYSFTLDVYKPLVFSRDRVVDEIRDMNTLLDDIDDLIDDHPRHANMLLKAKETWSGGIYQLKKLQKSVDKEVRHAWIAHDTMNQKTVDAKFAKQAVKLDKRINIELKKFRKLILNVHEMIRKDLSATQKQLVKGKPKTKQQKGNRNIPSFSTDTSEKLLVFSESIDSAVHTDLLSLINEISITEQRQEKVRNHLDDNQDLSEPLIKVIDYWKEAELKNREYFDQILYALESVLLGRKLGLHKGDYGIVSMNKTLKKQIPAILKKVQRKRDSIEKSY